MKKLLTLLLSLALVMSVSLFATSCGGDGTIDDTDDEGDGGEEITTPWIDVE